MSDFCFEIVLGVLFADCGCFSGILFTDYARFSGILFTDCGFI